MPLLDNEIDLSFERSLCPIHGEPFREGWPSCYGVYCISALQALMEEEDFQKETMGIVSQIHFALDRIPICCRLPTTKLLDLLESIQEQFNRWNYAPCEMCRRVALGTRIHESPKRAIHLCFCCLNRMSAHRILMGEKY